MGKGKYEQASCRFCCRIYRSPGKRMGQAIISGGKDRV